MEDIVPGGLTFPQWDRTLLEIPFIHATWGVAKWAKEVQSLDS